MLRDDKSDIDTKTAAERWGVSAGAAAKYCANGFVPGAVKIGRVWRIPPGTIKPLPLRDIVKLLRLVNALKHYPDSNDAFAVPAEVNAASVFQYLVSIGMVQNFDRGVAAERIPYEARLTRRGLDLVANDKKTKVGIDSEAVIKAGAAVVVQVAAELIKAAF